MTAIYFFIMTDTLCIIADISDGQEVTHMKRNDPLSVQIRLSKEEDEKLGKLAEGLGTNKPSVLRILLRQVKKIEVITEGLDMPWKEDK